MLAACNIQGKQAFKFFFNIAQSQYFVVLMQWSEYVLRYTMIPCWQWAYVARQKLSAANSIALYYGTYSFEQRFKWIYF